MSEPTLEECIDYQVELIRTRGLDSIYRPSNPFIDNAILAHLRRIPALEAENARLRDALEAADEWLAGWASADPYRAVIRAALTPTPGGDDAEAD